MDPTPTIASRRWRGPLGSGKSRALRQQVSDAVASGIRPISWLPASSDIGLCTERVEFKDQKIAESLGTIELTGRLVRDLSSGERQRVRLAFALSGDPKLVILDEPCRHLDPSHIAALNSTLALLTRSGTAIAVSDIRCQLDAALFDVEVPSAESGSVETSNIERSIAGHVGPRCDASNQQRSALELVIDIPFLLSRPSRPTGKLTIKIERRSVVVVSGCNGSGKTSLLEAISRSCKARRVACGYSRQEPEHHVFAATAAEELDEVSSLSIDSGWGGDAFLQHMDLVRWLAAPVPRLPHGVLCLIGTAIALRLGRDLVLLDEPTQGLDEQTARALAAELVGCAASGARIVVASHDPELLRVATEVWTVSGGDLVTGAVA